MTIAEIKNIAPDTFIERVAGRVSSAKNITTSTGKTMSVAKIGDDNDTVDLQSFDHNLLTYNNKEIQVEGKGIKVEEYKGYRKVCLLKAAKIVVTGEAAPPRAAQGATGGTSSASVHHPATVGLAAKLVLESIDLWNRSQHADSDARIMPNAEAINAGLKHWIERLEKAERGEL